MLVSFGVNKDVFKQHFLAGPLLIKVRYRRTYYPDDDITILRISADQVWDTGDEDFPGVWLTDGLGTQKVFPGKNNPLNTSNIKHHPVLPEGSGSRGSVYSTEIKEENECS